MSVTKRIAMGCVCLLLACAPEAGDIDASVLDAELRWPERLSELRAQARSSAIAYRPAHELWTNGSHKRREIFMPDGAAIDTSDRDRWLFPRDVLFLKTFFYRRADGSEYPVETRALRSLGDGFDYAAYAWSEDGSDALRVDGAQTTMLEVTTEEGAFEHAIPSRLECRKCHESQASAVLGFDALGLSEPLDEGAQPQLVVLSEAGVLSDLPDQASGIEHPDSETRAVLAYFEGNCVHCHNGSGLASSAFDLRHTVALDNLVHRKTEGQSIGGVRLVPGDAESSALYRALEGERLFPDVAAMPPIGVQRRDEHAIERIRGWIERMEKDGP